MINNTHAVNSHGNAVTLYDNPELVSRHLRENQSAAMNAALMIGAQYSPESKSQFRQVCLNHLKASLAPAQDLSA